MKKHTWKTWEGSSPSELNESPDEIITHRQDGRLLTISTYRHSVRIFIVEVSGDVYNWEPLYTESLTNLPANVIISELFEDED